MNIKISQIKESLNWISIHIFQTNDTNHFLLNAIHPLIESLKKDGYINQFFFVRYREKGPHIRLRLKPIDICRQSKIKFFLNGYFEHYFKKNESLRKDPDNLPENQRWYPNDSVEYIAYEPEIERYGGIRSLQVSEEQFNLSSEIVMNFIRSKKNLTYEDSLGTALQLHISFCWALGLNDGQVRFLFANMFQKWFYSSILYVTVNRSESVAGSAKKKIVSLFKQNYENQKFFLLRIMDKIISNMMINEKFDKEWLNNWIDESRKIAKKLNYLNLAGKIQVPDDYIDCTGGLMPEDKSIVYLCESYIHMTNNRLGILNRDEAYLFYLIKNLLNEYN
jgi:thiopeptide-type bacteriocin biosynthesis protein